MPFDIRRVYCLYDVPGGAERGGHAHRELQQVIIAMSGSFDVVLDDGRISQRFHLNRSYAGLYVPSMVWREIDNFSSGSVCMVLASEPYEEDDYYPRLRRSSSPGAALRLTCPGSRSSICARPTRAARRAGRRRSPG